MMDTHLPSFQVYQDILFQSLDRSRSSAIQNQDCSTDKGKNWIEAQRSQTRSQLYHSYSEWICPNGPKSILPVRAYLRSERGSVSEFTKEYHQIIS